MEQFQNSVSYKPGNKVLIYFISNSLTPIIIIAVLLVIGLSVLQNVLTNSSAMLGMLPFSPSVLTGYGVPVILVGSLVLAIIACISAWIQYSSVQFMFDEFAFHIERGLMSKNSIAIPFRQVQNVNHEQSFSEKMWGVARVVVETAGTDDEKNSHSDGLLPLLDVDTAQMLEQELLRRSSGK